VCRQGAIGVAADDAGLKPDAAPAVLDRDLLPVAGHLDEETVR